MNRVEKYLRKISYITENLSNLPPYDENQYYMESLLYRLHTSIDAVMDLVAMLVKDLGKEIKDDYSNITALGELGVINDALAEGLKRLNGLRNVIVHKYNKIDYNLIKESLDKTLNIIFDFIEVVKDVMQKIFGQD